VSTPGSGRGGPIAPYGNLRGALPEHGPNRLVSTERFEPLLTLEPLIEAIRRGVESGGWELSGFQKTTSHQFEGRWQGDSTRSAYLFFHHPEHGDDASLEAYLDETSRGLQANISVVVEGSSLGEIGDVQAMLGLLSAAASESLPPGLRTPLSLRIGLPRRSDEPASAEVEARFKVQVPAATIRGGQEAVVALVLVSVHALESLLVHPHVRGFADPG